MVIYNGRKVFEHRLIWKLNNGDIPKGCFIHHKNFDKLNNRIDNLECISRIEHGRKHWLPDRKRIYSKSGAVRVIKLPNAKSPYYYILKWNPKKEEKKS